VRSASFVFFRLLILSSMVRAARDDYRDDQPNTSARRLLRVNPSLTHLRKGLHAGMLRRRDA